MNDIDSKFLERLITKTMINDKDYAVLVSRVFDSNYFDDPYVSHIFSCIKTHLEDYNMLPEKDAVINSANDKDGVSELYDEVNSMDFDTVRNRKYLLDKTNDYLKEKALKQSIIESVDIIEHSGNREQIREMITNALSKDIKIDLGLNYFDEFGSRLKKIFGASTTRVPTYFPQFDEYLSGGFPPFTLSVIVARIHAGKCVEGKTLITIRNKQSGDIETIQVKDFFKRFSNLYKYDYDKNTKEGNSTMIGLDAMKKKYGDEEGTRRYNKWKENVSKSSKGRNTLEMFQRMYGDEEGKERQRIYIERSKKSSKRRIGYWIEKGFTEEESKKKISEIQTNFSKKMCIEKYGEEEGLKVWQDRQDRWQNTMKSKPQEEIDRINKLKSGSLGNFQRKYGEEDGLKRWIRKNEKKSKSSRKIDIELIEPYQQYIIEVRRLSERNILIHGLQDVDKRSRDFHLDHKVSMCYGFNNDISPDIIGSIHNLEIIPSSDNCSKKDENSINPQELIRKCNE